jgi:methionine-rich copper-binding protein CopC
VGTIFVTGDATLGCSQVRQTESTMSAKPRMRCGSVYGWRLIFAVSVLVVSGSLCPTAEAGSQPVAQAIISARHAEYVIRFDHLVDHTASRVEITQSGHVIQLLPALVNAAPDVLYASGEAPAPGQYMLHWHARSLADGTFSDGEIPFTVPQK